MARSTKRNPKRAALSGQETGGLEEQGPCFTPEKPQHKGSFYQACWRRVRRLHTKQAVWLPGVNPDHTTKEMLWWDLIHFMAKPLLGPLYVPD